MSKSTLNGSKLKKIKTSGFLKRLTTKKGIKILKRRRLKKRYKLTN